MKKVLTAVGVVSVGMTVFAVVPTRDGNGNYVFTIASGEEICSDVLSGANTLTGTYRVNSGMLQMSPTVLGQISLPELPDRWHFDLESTNEPGRRHYEACRACR